MIDQNAVDAIKSYKEEIGADDSVIMFPPGNRQNPTNMWSNMLGRFFKKHSLEVQSHDFRTTQATEFYKAT